LQWLPVRADCSGLAPATSLNVAQERAMPMVDAGEGHTVGLRSDGTVLALGDNDHGQCNVGDWQGIVEIAAGYLHTVGLRSDGTAVAVGNNGYGQCNLVDWTSIVQVAGGGVHTVGLRCGWHRYLRGRRLARATGRG
jgi:alpha-tubulin suppressor-like RCC1 family protein